jgi:hypothetical protein
MPPGQGSVFVGNGPGKTPVVAKAGSSVAASSDIELESRNAYSWVLYDKAGTVTQFVVPDEPRNAGKGVSLVRAVFVDGAGDFNVSCKGTDIAKALKSGAFSDIAKVPAGKGDVVVTDSAGKSLWKGSAPLVEGDAYTVFLVVGKGSKLTGYVLGNSAVRKPISAGMAKS